MADHQTPAERRIIEDMRRMGRTRQMDDNLTEQIKADREAGTPGPWVVGAKNGGTDERSVDSHHHSICLCHHHCVGSIEKEMEANAHLIAAAPDLYEALEGAIDDCEYSMSPDLFEECKAALEKARGEE